MPRKLKAKAPPTPAARKRDRDYGTSKFRPRISTNCKDGVVVLRNSKEATDLELPVRLECDFEGVQIRWTKFADNRVQDAGVYNGDRALEEDGFRPTIQAPVWLEGAGLCSYESAAVLARQAFEEIDDRSLTESPGVDQVPVIQLTDFETVKFSNGGSGKRPIWELAGFVQRRPEFTQYAAEKGIRLPTAIDPELNDPIDL